MTEPTREELAQWLEEAADDIANWGAYAGDYFQKKWNLEGDVQKFRDRADDIRGEVGINGLTEAETSATASVYGFPQSSRKSEGS